MKSFSEKSGTHTVYLSLGTNKGDREANLENALIRLKDVLSEIRRSSMYRTRPMYLADQPEFLNMAIEGKTALPARDFFGKIQGIEESAGRDRRGERRMGPRVIDIDLLLFDAVILSEPDLQIPHPRLYERQFVLIPLLELAPDLADPASGRPFSSFLADLPDQGVYRQD
jgi:2-amino-4-hydroxy-6-hydroxymethyldihydropteridine diphosphokinase